MYIYGFPGDALKYIYSFWLESQGLLKSVFPPQYAAFYILKFNTSVWGVILGYNVTVILAFLLAFFTGYKLSRSFLPKTSSLFAALLYTFSNYLTWHGLQNVEIILASAFLPWYFLSLITLEAKASRGVFSLKSSLWAALSFSLIFLCSFYLGYFAIIFSAFFLAFAFFYRYFSEKEPANLKSRGLSIFTLGLVVFLLTLPATGSLLRYELGTLKPSVALEFESGLSRNKVLDLVAYGARPWDYLLPSIYQPVFGRVSQNIYSYFQQNLSYQYWSTFLPERANFLTFTLLFLVALTIYTTVQKNRPASLPRREVFTWLFLALAMFFVSMPSIITFKGFNLPMPSYFLFRLFPMFRVYARAGIYVLLPLSLVAGCGLNLILEKVKTGKFAQKGYFSVAAIFFLLAIFENLNFPPFTLIDVSRVPKVYGWFREQNLHSVIAEYPRDTSVNDLGGGCPAWLEAGIRRDWNGSYEQFYQMYHGQAVFDFGSLLSQDRTFVGNLSDPQTPALLLAKGVKYVVAHTKDPMIGIHPWPYPQENPLDSCWRRRIMTLPQKVAPGFRQVARFDDGVIYEVN